MMRRDENTNIFDRVAEISLYKGTKAIWKIRSEKILGPENE